MQTEQIPWPPEYRLRKSRRAKYLQLKVSQDDGLEIVVPYRFGHYDLQGFLSSHRQWIEKKLRLHHQRLLQKQKLPERIQLLLTGEIWDLSTLSSSGPTKLKAFSNNSLLLIGDVNNIQQAHLCLQKWLYKKAKMILIPMLEKLSDETGLSFNNVSIRNQKTRWGSCSARADISLNYRLIFLPEPLVRYILIHELCHTRHLNHSKRFWALVAQFDPNYLHHKQEIHRQSEQASFWGGPQQTLSDAD